MYLGVHMNQKFLMWKKSFIIDGEKGKKDP